jgi:hypothetical protein
MSKEKVVGIYGDHNASVNDPNYLDTLQGEIGLNAIICGGYNLSANVRALNPATVPGGSTYTDDDSMLYKAQEVFRKRGIQSWAIFGGYHGMANSEPETMAYTLEGKRIDSFQPRLYAHEANGYTTCPNNEKHNAFLEAVLVDIAARYDFAGSAITHARYAHSAFIQGLLACGCETCEKKAGEFGFDFQRMKKAVLGTYYGFQKLTVDQCKLALKVGLGFLDFVEMMGQDAGAVADWFNYRAMVISHNFKRFQTAIHSVNPNFRFGSDTHYPTMALLVGHRYADLNQVCDQIVPLLSHNEIHFMDNIGSFANFLMESVPGLEDADATSLVYNFLGVHTPGLPKTVKDMQLGTPVNAELHMNPDTLQALVANEMYKVRLLSNNKNPSYPVIKGSFWPERVVRSLMNIAVEAGHDGIVLQGTDSLFTWKK